MSRDDRKSKRRKTEMRDVSGASNAGNAGTASTAARLILARHIIRRTTDDQGRTIDEVVKSSIESLKPLPAAIRASQEDYNAFNDNYHGFAGGEDEFDLGFDGQVPTLTARRVRSNAGDNPLCEWKEHLSEALNAMLCHDAFPAERSTCPECTLRPATVRCGECAGLNVLCVDCSVRLHQRQPLHNIEVWNGKFFDKSSLYTLGVRVFLGHHGHACWHAVENHHPFIVVHSNGVHHVRLNWCKCVLEQSYFKQLLAFGWFPATTKAPASAITFQALRQFDHLTMQCKSLSAYHYCQATSRIKDATGLTETKDRYRQFALAVRIFRHLRMAKHAGRGHVPNGLATTVPRDCVVECPSCPLPGKNVPASGIAPGPSWLNTRLICLDANFRLKRYGKKNEVFDPALGDGWAYIVESKPYNQWLVSHGAQTEMSSCNGLKAVDHANLRNSKGYAVSGQGRCDCARHGFKLAGADLQKGEKYCTMDFIFLTAVQHLGVPRLLVSYDIMCQWSVNLQARINMAPRPLRIDLDRLECFLKAIPNFHIYGHQASCMTYSLHYQVGVGQTCAEIVEAGWSRDNDVAGATAAMSEGGRHDCLNAHWSFSNWLKTVTMADFNSRKLLEAATEFIGQKDTLEQLTASIENTAKIQSWRDMITAWNDDNTKPNPYEQPVGSTGPTQAQIRAELAREEATAHDNGIFTLHDISPSVWLTTGFELEEARHRLSVEPGASAGATDNQKATYLERVNAMRRKINSWQQVQAAYMPGVARFLETLPSSPDVPVVPSLWLPSAIPDNVRDAICVVDLGTIEARLRRGQAEQALAALRNQLRVKNHFVAYRKDHVRGQRAGTHANSIIDSIDHKTALCASRYRRARAALTTLEPNGSWSISLKPLLNDDIRFLSESAAEAWGAVQLPSGSRPEGRERDSSCVISWIWLNSSSAAPTAAEQAIFEDFALRVQWTRQHARTERWEEQLTLVREEMRRTVAFFRWKAGWWRGQLALRPDKSELLSGGLAAYAERQASMYDGLADHAERRRVEAGTKADAVLLGSSVINERPANVVMDDVGYDDVEE